ncbi:MAG: radical SAM protein [Desulfobacteraceae bacterium]|nr:radical SAM protein [Desulfobacteraceae bacterium]
MTDSDLTIMIAYPPLKGDGSPMLTQNRQFQWYNNASFIFPMVTASAATLLQTKGYRVVWNDCITLNKDYEYFLETIRETCPDVIALETKTPVVQQHWEIIRDLNTLFPKIRTILMGDHVTALPLESMEKSPVDYVITGGDYDFLLLSIADVLSGKAGEYEPGIWYREKNHILNSGPFLLDHDLDSLPFIDRNLTMAHLYGEKWKKRTPFFYTMAGRDCPWHHCTFCSWTTLFPKFRSQSVNRLLDEIEFLIEEHGAREIFDDSGTIPGGEWLQEFCQGMIDRGFNKKILFSCNMRFDYLGDIEIPKLMKKAGFRKIKSGLESANQNTLDRIKKGIKVADIVQGCKNASRAGIDVHLTAMVGYPWESREHCTKTLDLSKWLMRKGHAEMLQATVVVPYPGTPLYQYVKDNDLLICQPDDYEKFDMRGSVIKTKDITSDEIVEMCNGIYKSFLSPEFIIRQVIRNIGDVDYLIRGAKSVMGHLKDFDYSVKNQGKK